MIELPSLDTQLRIHDINAWCRWVGESTDDEPVLQLYPMIYSQDARVASNVLWILTHCKKDKIQILESRQDEMIDYVLSSIENVRIRRLLLVLLERQTFSFDNVRLDFLDYCLNRMISCDSCAVRALCMKLAFKMCRYCTELMRELTIRVTFLTDSELSSGLRAVKKNICSQIDQLSKSND